jgi:ABC-type glycerol-3-phosphate transport system permease component
VASSLEQEAALPGQRSAPLAAGSRRGTAAETVRTVLLHVVVSLGAAVALFPFWWMVTASFKTDAEIFALPPTVVPMAPTLENVTNVFTKYPFAHWFLNSVSVVLLRVPLLVFLTSLAGFAFAKYDFRLRGALFFVVLGSMTIPFQTLMVPLYTLTIQTGLKNTLWPLFIPQLANGFGIFLMRQFMTMISDELLDSARIDGCSEFGIFWRIAAPLARPALATLAILSFMRAWNDFVWPLIVLKDKEMFTLPVGLAIMRGYSIWKVPWGEVMAASFIASVPILLIFLLMQRHFIGGLQVGSVKA